METEVYPHLRLEPDLVPQETLLRLQVTAARHRCEVFTSRQLINATWELWLDGWNEARWGGAPGCISIPRAPLIDVVSVSYTDTGGVEQTLPPDLYIVTAPQGPMCSRGHISPVPYAIWPTAQRQPAAVKVRFTAGYGPNFTTVPAELRQGMLLTVGELDGTREEQTAGTIVSPNVLRAEHLWYPFRVW